MNVPVVIVSIIASCVLALYFLNKVGYFDKDDSEFPPKP